MFSATLQKGTILKKIVEAIKDVVVNINLEVSAKGLSLQAMDPTHIALVTLSLKPDGFTQYRCDKSFKIGLKLLNLYKILKCSENDDSIVLECDSNLSTLKIIFESKKQEKKSTFNLNLSNFDQENLQIPETVYSSRVTLSSSVFSKMIKEISHLSENIKILTIKNRVIFSINGDSCSGEIEIKENKMSQK